MLKSNTFRGKKYSVEFVSRIDGVCDTDEDDGGYEMAIVDAEGLRGLDNALHEAMHAAGIPTEYIHRGNGTIDISRFLWRLGYRRKA